MSEGPILVYDGVCHLCQGLVRFVIERDPEGRVRFAHRQSAAARERLAAFGLAPEAFDAVALIEEGRLAVASDAALRLFGHLRGAWPWLQVFLLVPRPLRDVVYRWIARNRYRWFGRDDTCLAPTPELRGRFLDDGH